VNSSCIQLDVRSGPDSGISTQKYHDAF